MKYFHIPNTHFSIPSFFHIRKKPMALRYNVRFNKSCRYDLDNLDQRDWNKLNGITNALFGNAQYSQTFMLAWRYNVVTEKFEVGAYLHDHPQQQRSTPEDNGCIWELDGETCVVRVILVKDIMVVYINEQQFNIDTNIRFNWLTRATNPWFGGNNPAPKFIHYDVEFEIV